jgi:hypothetical protein
VKQWWLLLRSFLIPILSTSLLLTPAFSAFGRGLPGLPGMEHGPPLPPFPAGLPFPVPGPPTVVVETGGHLDYRGHRSYRHERRDWRYEHRPHGGWSYGRVHRSLPAGVFTLHLGGAMFSYHSGTYYRHSPRGYVVVQAPVGARVRTLPDTCLPVDFEGRRYYDCNEVYYEGDGEDYVVIEGLPRTYVELIAVAGDEVRVRAESLNVRTGPGTRYQVVSKLYRGDIVEVDGSDQGWYHIILADGSYGWVLRDHTRFYRTKDEVKG